MKMKMKKTSAIMLAASLIACVMTGCGAKAAETGVQNAAETGAVESESVTAGKEKSNNGQEINQTGEAPNTDTAIEPCEITFWHAMSEQQEKTLTELTEQFNSENQYGIKVTLVNQGYYNDLSTKLTANAAADTLPDMAQAYNSWLIPYLDKVVRLDDFVASDFDQYDDLIESYRNECSQFGFINAVPFNKSTYVYFYNKTMFDELGLKAPETWADLEEIGKTMMDGKQMVSLGFDDLAGMLEASIRQNGGEYVTEAGAQFDNEKGLEAVTFITNLYSNGYARLVGEDGYFSGPLSNQLIGAYVGSSTGASYVDTSSGWELGVAPLPGNVQKAANQAGTNLVMFSKEDNKQKAVWEFMKFLTSADSTVKWAMETGYLPVRTSAYESETYQNFMKNDPTAQAAYSQSEDFFTSPVFEKSYDIQSAVNTALEELILSKKGAEESLKQLVDAVNSQLR